MPKDLIIPDFLKHLAVDARGYVIPYFVPIIDGKPDFRMLDEKKQILCIKNKLCLICGKRLLKGTMFFISGPVGVKNRVSTDPPAHRECAEYSLAVCPHLLLQKAQCNERGDQIKDLQSRNPIIQAEKSGEIRNPDKIFLIRSSGYNIFPNPSGTGSLLKYKFDLIEEYQYQNGVLIKTGESSKEIK